MDVFNFRNQIIEDYSGYVSSFISIAQSRLREFVDRCFKSGSLWPDPLIQLNPTFKPGKTVAELVQEGVLASGCTQVFRREKTAVVGSGEDLLFHQHQEDAIRKAKEGRNYVLTTGTGSGKSLSYIVPIVDHVLRAGSGRGIQAIIIYPMNALANSQFGELEKFLKLGFAGGKGPVTFERYTGQEDEETRTRIFRLVGLSQTVCAPPSRKKTHPCPRRCRSRSRSFMPRQTRSARAGRLVTVPFPPVRAGTPAPA